MPVIVSLRARSFDIDFLFVKGVPVSSALPGIPGSPASCPRNRGFPVSLESRLLGVSVWLVGWRLCLAGGMEFAVCCDLFHVVLLCFALLSIAYHSLA